MQLKAGEFLSRCLSAGLLFGIAIASTCKAQCSAIASTPQYASDCAARAIPANKIAAIDVAHPYSLAELVDIAEQNNPTTLSTLQPDARESVYAETLMSRYRDLHSLLTTFTRMFDHPIESRIDIASPPFLQQKPSDVSLREDERNH